MIGYERYASSQAHQLHPRPLRGQRWAVLEREDGEVFNVPRFWLPPALHEGDVLVLEVLPDLFDMQDETGITLNLYVDAEATEQRREQAKAKRGRLKKGPAGDISL